MRMEEKPKRRLLTKSTGQADLTGVKRPHRLAFCTSQQREVFSMEHDGSETIQDDGFWASLQEPPKAVRSA